MPVLFAVVVIGVKGMAEVYRIIDSAFKPVMRSRRPDVPLDTGPDPGT